MADTITIYKQQYRLPTLATERFTQVQQRIRERQQMIQAGRRTQQTGVLGRWFGGRTITKTQMQELSVDERFAVMKELMSEYVAMLGMLDTHKGQYDRLLTQIGDGIREFAAERCQKYLQTDANLTAIEQDALADHDDSDLRSIGADRARLIQTIRLLGQAMLLIAKKIDLFRAGLNKIAEDQELKRSLVDKKRRKLNRQYQMYLVKKEIVEFQQEVSEILKVALNFEELMRECFGPLQALLEEVTGMDGAFAGAAEEIDNLTRVIMNDAAGNTALAALDDAEEDLLNFLLHSQMQRDRLADVVNQAWQADAETQFDAEFTASGAISVQQALENLRTFLDVRLPIVTTSVSISTPLNMTTIELGGGVVLELIEIPGGTFQMGSPNGQGEKNEHPQHTVTLAPFYMAKYPTTQAQWQAVMGSNPSNFKGANRPVEQVSWDDAQEFVSRLRSITQRSLSGVEMTFRLPTEAEWEYACRAGAQTAYCFGDDPAQLDEYAWYSSNSGSQTHPVGEKSPNTFGVYDMHGNVWEWCADSWHDSYNGAPTDGSIWGNLGDIKANRLLRGGSWDSNPPDVRCADRDGNTPANRNFNVGMRVVCVR